MLEMTMTENVSIHVSHFYCEGYKDLLTLNVLSEHYYQKS